MHSGGDGGDRNAPKSVEFTPELKIWYTETFPQNNLQRPRVEVYFAQVLSDQQGVRKKYNRMKRIEGTIKTTTKIEAKDVVAWIKDEYPFAQIRGRRASDAMVDDVLKPKRTVRDEVIVYCKATFENKAVSLKLLWYLYPKLEEILGAYNYPIWKQMACSDMGILNIRTAMAEDYLQHITTENGLTRTKEARVMVLHQVLKFAVKQGHCYKNVLESIVATQDEERKRLAEIRNALSKRTFTPIEMKKIYDFAAHKIDHENGMEYLGVLIRLMTGLESNIVSALSWKDFYTVEIYNFAQYGVRRQLVNNGADYVGFEKEYSYRWIPCPSVLYQHMKKQWERVCKRTVGWTDEQRGNLPIVTRADWLHKEETRYMAFSPIQLEQISKEAVLVAGIPAQVILLSDQNKGTVETNLAHYHGDIFRSNFRFYGLQSVHLEDGELAYLIGNKASTTFEKFYFDYTNPAEQHEMWVKMSSWCETMMTPQMRCVERSVLDVPELENSFMRNGILTAGIQITVESTGNDVIEVELQSKYGLDCTVCREGES